MNINTSLPNVNEILNLWTNSQKIEFFESALRSTGRQGIENIIEFCKSTDFYYAPSSASFHSNYQGGLLDHSILVYVLAMKYRDTLGEMHPELVDKLPVEELTISALLHDICKVCFYQKVQKWRKDANNQWESYEGYEINDSFPIGHGEKSVIMLQNLGLVLQPSEMLAIRYHMGSWDGAMRTNDLKFSYSKAIDICPLITVLQHADNACSMLFERKIN
jgi:hypothetical protein